MPLERVRGGGWPGATAAATGRRLHVDGADVSAVLRDATGALVLRVVNISPEPSVVTMARDDGPCVGTVVDLTGAVQAEFAGSAPLRPWEILTLRLVGA